MLRLLKFVNEGNGVVLVGDFAVALGIADELVSAEAEGFSVRLPGSKKAAAS